MMSNEYRLYWKMVLTKFEDWVGIPIIGTEELVCRRLNLAHLMIAQLALLA